MLCRANYPYYLWSHTTNNFVQFKPIYPSPYRVFIYTLHELLNISNAHELLGRKHNKARETSRNSGARQIIIIGPLDCMACKHVAILFSIFGFPLDFWHDGIQTFSSFAHYLKWPTESSHTFIYGSIRLLHSLRLWLIRRFVNLLPTFMISAVSHRWALSHLFQLSWALYSFSW